MTAPVLHHYHNGERTPLRDSTLYKIGPAFGSTRWRLSTGQPHGVRGDLWEREAERDVQVHGQPEKFEGRFPLLAQARRRGELGVVYAYLRGEVERRRPEMRLARTTDEGKH